MMYESPNIEVAELTVSLLSASGPDATSIGSPNVDDNYSIWDEVKQYNNKEEQDYEENWI